MADILLTERVYTDADGLATTDEARAVRLWGTPGYTVTEAEAAAIGYGGEVSSPPAPEPPAFTSKSVSRPPRHKAVMRPGGDK